MVYVDAETVALYGTSYRHRAYRVYRVMTVCGISVIV